MDLRAEFRKIIEESKKVALVDAERAKEAVYGSAVAIEHTYEAILHEKKEMKLDGNDLELMMEMYVWLRDNGYALSRVCAGVVAFIVGTTGMSFEELERL